MERNIKKDQSGRYVKFGPMTKQRRQRRRDYSDIRYYATQFIYGVLILLSVIAALGYTAYLFMLGMEEAKTKAESEQVIENEVHVEKEAYVISEDKQNMIIVDFMATEAKESAAIMEEAFAKVSQQPVIEVNNEPKSDYPETLSTFAELNSKAQELLKQSMTCTGPKDQYVFNVSSIERLYMECIVYNEARGEPFEGQVSVAATILNRYMSSAFSGKTIAEICTQPYQYAFSQVPEERLSMTSVKEAVDQALRGYDPTRITFADGARFFYNPDGTSQEELEMRQGIIEYTVGHHHFHDDFSK